jgi:hypothetical protein
MAVLRWYELNPQRLVLESIRVNLSHPGFRLRRANGSLSWRGQTDDVPPGVLAPPLKYWVYYRDAFPAVPPAVWIVSPEIDPSEWGHKWHRWQSGDVCYVRPSRWQVSTTCDEIISKVSDWYFNYTAKKAGLIAEMPETGRACIRLGVTAVNPYVE